MATDQDLVVKGENREVLDRVFDTFEDGYYHDSDPLQTVAALLVLDELSGVAQEDDRVVIHPGLGVWLFLVARVDEPQHIADLALRLRHIADQEDQTNVEPLDDDDDDLPADWFTVVFDLEEDGQPFPYHPRLQGKTLRVRFMTDEEYSQADFMCATVRAADGQVVQPEAQQIPRFT